MFTSHKQISPPSLVLKLKISEVSQKWIPKAVELKRIPTHKKCKCKKFCSQTRLVGEIYLSDVIMHRGYCKPAERVSYTSVFTHHEADYIVSLYHKWIGVVERDASLNSTSFHCKNCRNITPIYKLYDVAPVPFRKSHNLFFWQVVRHSWSNQREPKGIIGDKFSINQN